MMGTGNLTELTDADSVGMTAMLLGICSELRHRQRADRPGQPAHAPHARRSTTPRGASCTRRAADQSLPKGYGRALLQVHDRAPFPEFEPPRSRNSRRRSKDAQFPHRGRRGRHSRLQPRRPSRRARTRSRCSTSSASRRDGAHAFYLGAELMKAEIALRLGKRYAQDEPLDWGCATDRAPRIATGSPAGHTLRARRPRAEPCR